jgi:hypothetical protein
MENKINKIKEGNYWRIHIIPSLNSFNPNKIKSLEECYNIIKKNTVQTHGWGFPFIQKGSLFNEYGDPQFVNKGYIENEIYKKDWLKEIWRFYKDAQFILFKEIEEDHRLQEIKERGNMPYFLNFENDTGKYFNIERSIYQVTEVFEFSKRLIESNIIDANFKITILLKGMKNRILFFWTSDRDFVPVLKCDDDNILFEKEYNPNEFQVNYLNLSLECITKIMEYYNFHATYLFKELQSRFYSDIILS